MRKQHRSRRSRGFAAPQSGEALPHGRRLRKSFSFSPGFSRVNNWLGLLANRFNGFVPKPEKPLTWLKPGANEKAAQNAHFRGKIALLVLLLLAACCLLPTAFSQNQPQTQPQPTPSPSPAPSPSPSPTPPPNLHQWGAVTS